MTDASRQTELTRMLLVSWVTGLIIIVALLGGLVHTSNDLAASKATILTNKAEAADQRRELDTCLKWHEACTATVTMQEEAAKKCGEELAKEKEEHVSYSELFNSFTAGVISTDVITYMMDDKELRAYCHSNWELNIGKNYKGAKLADFSTLELNRTRSGTLFLVTCYWAVPSTLWCDKKAKSL